jgi:hypothetical protein
MVMKKAFAELVAVAAIGAAVLPPTKADAWWEWDAGKAYGSDHAAYHAAPRAGAGFGDAAYRSRAEWRGRALEHRNTR